MSDFEHLNAELSYYREREAKNSALKSFLGIVFVCVSILSVLEWVFDTKLPFIFELLWGFSAGLLLAILAHNYYGWYK